MGLRILIVEDSAFIRVMERQYLMTLGDVEFTEAQDGVQARERLKDDGPFDLLLVDWHMPKLDGIDFIREVREDPNHKDVPIIMVTSESGTDEYREAQLAGIDGFIPKPFDEKTLHNKIRLVLNAKKRGSGRWEKVSDE